MASADKLQSRPGRLLVGSRAETLYFRPGAFAPPAQPEDASGPLRTENEALQRKLADICRAAALRVGGSSQEAAQHVR